jgi:hypothetical protein
VRSRAGFSPISVTQKTTLVFWLPQREYREALAEWNADIANANNLLVLEFFNCCILAQNQVWRYLFQDNRAKIKNSTTNKLFFRPYRSLIVSQTKPENRCRSLQTCILDELKILSHSCPNAVIIPISMPHCILEALLRCRSSFYPITDHPGAFSYN